MRRLFISLATAGAVLLVSAGPASANERTNFGERSKAADSSSEWTITRVPGGTAINVDRTGDLWSAVQPGRELFFGHFLYRAEDTGHPFDVHMIRLVDASGMYVPTETPTTVGRPPGDPFSDDEVRDQILYLIPRLSGN
jgi:hypothetical protein